MISSLPLSFHCCPCFSYIWQCDNGNWQQNGNNNAIITFIFMHTSDPQHNILILIVCPYYLPSPHSSPCMLSGWPLALTHPIMYQQNNTLNYPGTNVVKNGSLFEHNCSYITPIILQLLTGHPYCYTSQQTYVEVNDTYSEGGTHEETLCPQSKARVMNKRREDKVTIRRIADS